MGQVSLSVHAAAAHHSPCIRFTPKARYWLDKVGKFAQPCRPSFRREIISLVPRPHQTGRRARAGHETRKLSTHGRARDKYMGGAGLQEMHFATLKILQSITYSAMRCTCNVVSYAQLAIGSLEHLCSVHVLEPYC